MPVNHLHSLLRSRGPQPLVTHYSPAGRSELSVVTFANWVDKTANFIDELDVASGEQITLQLAATHPGHWVTGVWLLAAWQRGVRITPERSAQSVLTVIGPGGTVDGVCVACSLHPLGLPHPDLPAGATDFVEVLSQPDLHAVTKPDPLAEAWLGVRFDSLSSIPGRSSRELFVDPAGGWDLLVSLFIAPILGGGSSLIVEGLAHDEVSRIAKQEKI